MSSLDIFKLFFTLEIIAQLYKFTNENAAAVGPTEHLMIRNWEDLQSGEFYSLGAC
jgi:hypothetical protein